MSGSEKHLDSEAMQRVGPAPTESEFALTERDYRVASWLEALGFVLFCVMICLPVVAEVAYNNPQKNIQEVLMTSGQSLLMLVAILPLGLLYFTLTGGLVFALVLVPLGMLAEAAIPPFGRVRAYRNAVEYWKAKVKAETERLLATRLAYWRSLDGRAFELAVADLLRRYGLDANATPASGDGGVDILIHNGGKLVAVVECKAYSKPVGVGVLRSLYASATDHGTRQAYLVAREGTTKGAREYAEEHGIKIINVHGLIRMGRAVTQRTSAY